MRFVTTFSRIWLSRKNHPLLPPRSGASNRVAKDCMWTRPVALCSQKTKAGMPTNTTVCDWRSGWRVFVLAVHRCGYSHAGRSGQREGESGEYHRRWCGFFRYNLVVDPFLLQHTTQWNFQDSVKGQVGRSIQPRAHSYYGHVVEAANVMGCYHRPLCHMVVCCLK